MLMYDFLDKIGLKAVLEAIKGKIPTVSNPNLLINPDFKINQRGVSIIDTPGTYSVDRWKLVSGNVMVDKNGIYLDGTISQTLENSVGTNVTASVSAGNATYDDTTKTFTITGNGVTVSWAKLEYGSAATPFIPPDSATELLKCCRYFQVIRPGSPLLGIVVNSSRIRITMPVVCPMQKNPKVNMQQNTGDFTWSFKLTNAAGASSFTTNDFSAMSVVFIRTDGSSIELYINVSHTMTANEMVYASGGGGIYFELDSEI